MLRRRGSGAARTRREPERVVAAVAAVAAVVLATALVAALFLGAGNGYSVTARFQNAGQLVRDDRVEIGGHAVGKVTRIGIAPDGHAAVTMHIDGDYAPLHAGTQAVVRAPSLVGVANRTVELLPGPETRPRIPDGGEISADDTTSLVELDNLFDTFDRPTRKALGGTIRGLDALTHGQGEELNSGLRYLDPAFATSARLFSEANRDNALLSRFIVRSADFASDVASRREHVAGLVDHLATTLNAIGSRRDSLAEAIRRLPDYMRRSNTTYVSLRHALDELDPLIDVSRPAARKLAPVLRELRPVAQRARPTVTSLARLAQRSGPDNDLLDLLHGAPPLRDIAIGPVFANGKQREGAYPAAAKALTGSTGPLSFARPYAVDLTGWFDDFSHTGGYDALGGLARVGLHFAAFSSNDGGLVPVPPDQRDELVKSVAVYAQRDRCPGSAERDPGDHSTPYVPFKGFHCDPTQVPPGK